MRKTLLMLVMMLTAMAASAQDVKTLGTVDNAVEQCDKKQGCCKQGEKKEGCCKKADKKCEVKCKKAEQKQGCGGCK